jgi:hypothetical protein
MSKTKSTSGNKGSNPKTPNGGKTGKGKKGGYPKGGGKIILVLEEYCAKDLFVQLAQALGGPVNQKKKGKKGKKGTKGGGTSTGTKGGTSKGAKGGTKGVKGAKKSG